MISSESKLDVSMTSHIQEHIGMSSLKELRQRKGMTAFTLAVKSNVSLSTITRMESGDEKRAVSRLIANRVLTALSAELGEKITIEDVDGLKIKEDLKHKQQEGGPE